jgi:hypothetical protein
MSSEATIDGVAAGTIPSPAPIVRHAGRVIGAAGALGIVGQLLFFRVGLGINFPIAISLLLAGGWLLRRQRPWPVPLDAWLGPAAMLFAVFAVVRADPVIVALDLLTSAALAGGALASFGGRPVVARSFGALIGLALALIGWATGGAFPAITQAHGGLPHGRSVARRAAPALPVLRGLIVAIPIVLVFIALFSSADAVFARVVENLFGFELDLGDVGWRIGLAAVLAWLAAGGLALAASVPMADGSAAAAEQGGWRVGTVEALTVLLAVDAVFVVFVALQGAYLFGGLDTLAVAGMTYADYARRGFFELVAVAVLAGGLVIAADRLACRRGRWLVAAAIGLALLTGVVLVSAALRLRLYQDAYGWTELRLYVLATIVLLGLAVASLVAALLTNRVRWMGHVLIVAALGIGLALNIIGPARFITEQNVARVLDPRLVPANGRAGLDETYAVTLGDDAVPALIRVLPALGADDARFLRDELGFRLDQLRADEGLNAWQAWNAGRSTARDALERADDRGELP